MAKFLPATQRKLDKARKGGDVSKSSLLSSSIILTIGISYTFYYLIRSDFAIPWFLADLLLLEHLKGNNILECLKISLQKCVGFLSAYLVLMFVVGVIVESMQVGFYFTPLKMDFSKLNLIEGFKKNILKHSEGQALMLGLLLEIVKMLAMLASSILVWFVLLRKYSMLLMPGFNFNALQCFVFFYLVSIVVLILFFGIADYAFAYIKRRKRLMMDVVEFKKEMRESEGDPHLKGMRKQLHQEISTRAAVDAVRKAKVLLVGRQSS